MTKQMSAVLLCVPHHLSHHFFHVSPFARALCQREPEKVLELENLHRESLKAADIIDEDRRDAAFDSDDEGSTVLDKRVCDQPTTAA